MKKKLVFILLYINSFVYAQQALTADAFRKLTTTEQRFNFLDPANIRNIDKSTFMALLPIIQEKNDQKTLFYWYLILNWNIRRFDANVDDAFQKNIQMMVEIARKNKFSAEQVVAQYQQTLNDYSRKKLNEQQSYSIYLNCFEQMKNIGLDKFKYYSPEWMLHAIGRNFYELGDNEKALDCLMEAEKITLPESNFYTLTLNLIESIYASKKDYPQAIAYAQKIYDTNYKLNPSQNPEDWLHTYWQGLSSLDIADYMFEIGKLAECETYAERGYKLSKVKDDLTQNDKVWAEFEALQMVIKIKLQLGKLNDVESLFKRAEILKPHLGLGMEGFYFKPIHLYKNYVSYYEAKKDYTNAYRYIKLANELQDSLNRRNDKRKLWQIESRVKADRYQAQIKSAEDESYWQQRLRNAAIIAMLIVAISSFVIYRRIKNDNKIIAEQKTLLEQSLGEKETLLKEIHHRVKNNLQIISGLFDKQARKATDETTKKMMKEGQDRVFSIALVHQNLYQSDNLSTIEIKSYLEMLTKNIEKSQAVEQQNIELKLDVDDTTLDIDTAIPLGLVLNELITNCYKYAFKGRDSGEIKIVFYRNFNEFWLNVLDNGIGLPHDFDIKKTRSLGMNLVRGLVRQMNGELEFKTSEFGTVFNIKCPA